jgi:hypothetical protein
MEGEEIQVFDFVFHNRHLRHVMKGNIMNPKVNFWAILTGLTAIVSVVAMAPVQAAIPSTEGIEPEGIGQRIAKLREIVAQQAIGQTVNGKQAGEGTTLLSQWWDNQTGSGWTNTPTWTNWNNGSTSPSWNNAWANWDNWRSWDNT